MPLDLFFAASLLSRPPFQNRREALTFLRAEPRFDFDEKHMMLSREEVPGSRKVYLLDQERPSRKPAPVTPEEFTALSGVQVPEGVSILSLPDPACATFRFFSEFPASTLKIPISKAALLRTAALLVPVARELSMEALEITSSDLGPIAFEISPRDGVLNLADKLPQLTPEQKARLSAALSLEIRESTLNTEAALKHDLKEFPFFLQSLQLAADSPGLIHSLLDVSATKFYDVIIGEVAARPAVSLANRPASEIIKDPEPLDRFVQAATRLAAYSVVSGIENAGLRDKFLDGSGELAESLADHMYSELMMRLVRRVYTENPGISREEAQAKAAKLAEAADRDIAELKQRARDILEVIAGANIDFEKYSYSRAVHCANAVVSSDAFALKVETLAAGVGLSKLIATKNDCAAFQVLAGGVAILEKPRAEITYLVESLRDLGWIPVYAKLVPRDFGMQITWGTKSQSMFSFARAIVPQITLQALDAIAHEFNLSKSDLMDNLSAGTLVQFIRAKAPRNIVVSRGAIAAVSRVDNIATQVVLFTSPPPPPPPRSRKAKPSLFGRHKKEPDFGFKQLTLEEFQKVFPLNLTGEIWQVPHSFCAKFVAIAEEMKDPPEETRLVRDGYFVPPYTFSGFDYTGLRKQLFGIVLLCIAMKTHKMQNVYYVPKGENVAGCTYTELIEQSLNELEVSELFLERLKSQEVLKASFQQKIPAGISELIEKSVVNVPDSDRAESIAKIKSYLVDAFVSISGDQLLPGLEDLTFNQCLNIAKYRQKKTPVVISEIDVTGYLNTLSRKIEFIAASLGLGDSSVTAEYGDILCAAFETLEDRIADVDYTIVPLLQPYSLWSIGQDTMMSVYRTAAMLERNKRLPFRLIFDPSETKCVRFRLIAGEMRPTPMWIDVTSDNNPVFNKISDVDHTHSMVQAISDITGIEYDEVHAAASRHANPRNLAELVRKKVAKFCTVFITRTGRGFELLLLDNKAKVLYAFTIPSSVQESKKISIIEFEQRVKQHAQVLGRVGLSTIYEKPYQYCAVFKFIKYK